MVAYVFPKLASEIWRLYEVDGNPGSGKHKPEKLEIQEWATVVQDTIAALKLTEVDYTLTTTKDLWVSQTGNDTTGDGTSGNPWATLTKAWTEVIKYNLNNQRLRIRFVGTPTLTSTGTLLAMSSWPRGPGIVELLGDTTTPANVKLQSSVGSPGSVLQVRSPQGSVTLQLSGLEVTSTGANAAALDHNGQGKVIIDRCRFSATGSNAFCIKINGNNSHIESGSGNLWIFGTTLGTGILVDSGYFISVGTIVYEGTPTFTASQFECNFGGRMFLTLFSGAVNAASLTRAIVKDRSLMRIHGISGSPPAPHDIPTSGAISVQPGSVFDNGGFAIQHSCFPVAHGLVAFSGGLPAFTQSYQINNLLDNGTGITQITLQKRMKLGAYQVVATQNDIPGGTLRVTYDSDQVFTVRTFDATNAAADSNFSFAVFGDQRADY